jgi:hypothetical protein
LRNKKYNVSAQSTSDCVCAPDNVIGKNFDASWSLNLEWASLAHDFPNPDNHISGRDIKRDDEYGNNIID